MKASELAGGTCPWPRGQDNLLLPRERVFVFFFPFSGVSWSVRGKMLKWWKGDTRPRDGRGEGEERNRRTKGWERKELDMGREEKWKRDRAGGMKMEESKLGKEITQRMKMETKKTEWKGRRNPEKGHREDEANKKKSKRIKNKFI